MRISARARSIVPSATLAVDAKAKALVASGQDVIGFAAGEPDFPTPAHIVEAAARAAAESRWHRYSPAAGLPELRAAVAANLTDNGVSVAPSQVVVTNGGKHAIYQVFQTLVDLGDEVLLPVPYWTTYPESIALAGGRAVPVHPAPGGDLKVGVDELAAALTPSTKGLVFVSPSNPAGTVYTEREMAAIGRFALENGLWVLTDEIYEHLVYEPAEFHSIASVVPELAESTVIVSGVAKSYAMTGWRVGWIAGPEPVATAAADIQSHLCSNVANIAQVAALAALTGDQSCVAQMRAAFARRRAAMIALLGEIPGISLRNPEGAFYVFPDVTELLTRTFGGVVPGTTLGLAELLLEQAGIAVVPGEAFGMPGHIRMSYALGDDALAEGISRLAKAVTDSTQ
jgi:aspartate aminotransferase